MIVFVVRVSLKLRFSVKVTRFNIKTMKLIFVAVISHLSHFI